MYYVHTRWSQLNRYAGDTYETDNYVELANGVEFWPLKVKGFPHEKVFIPWTNVASIVHGERLRPIPVLDDSPEALPYVS
jgi:hypothetical protein